MLSPFKRRRRRLLTSGAVAGAVLASMAFAGSAGASTVASANSTIVGSGSSTTYYMMQQLDTLFNDAQGCQIYDPTGAHQPLNFACASQAPGYVAPESLAPGNGENPYNDISVEEPYIGSSNGINQLKYQGSNTPSNGFQASPINYARSSRALKSTDTPGENFVAYAKDGVDWVTFSAVNNKHQTYHPSQCVPGNDIEEQYLVDIWNGTISNWAQLCADIAYAPATPTKADYAKYAADNAPICVYDAQDGSGTLATWDSYLGITTENFIGTLTPNTTSSAWAQSVGLSATPVNFGCTNGTNASAYGATHQIFENETEQILSQGVTQVGNGHQYSDTSDAIFFYSYGRYELQCHPGEDICEPTGFTLRLGEIGHQLPDKTNIIASDAPGFSGIPWAVPRYLYNVYANGDTSGNLVPATSATLNYVSEIGFLCKPQTETVVSAGREVSESIVDPNTGATYLSEIDAIIDANGFFPLPFQSAEDQGTIDYPAANLLPTYGSTDDAYGVFDPNYNASLTPAQNAAANIADKNPSGYCKVFSTSA